MPIKIHYNAPVVLSFSLLSSALFILDYWIFQRWITTNFLTLKGHWDWGNPIYYLRLFTYPLGHADAGHIIGNLSLFLLIAPIMEEKYGSKPVLNMMLLTSFVTGVLQVLLFDTGLLGASGLVFMFIVLVSFADMRHGSVPLTFILVVAFFLGKEVINASGNNGISEYAHIMGGIMGGFFGFSEKKLA